MKFVGLEWVEAGEAWWLEGAAAVGARWQPVWEGMNRGHSRKGFPQTCKAEAG